jgi:hypothetical protein|tara:strand:+ start:812 stop:2077 length:1266 start_codon:yes stop_codon:yes gene_type:complete
MATQENVPFIDDQNIGTVKSGTPPIICCTYCYSKKDGKDVHCCVGYGFGSFFGCQGCFSTKSSLELKPFKACQSYTAVARSVVHLLIVVFGLLTIMEFGNMMDKSHFPGSGIQLDRYDEGNNTDLLWDSFKDGYFLEVVDLGQNDENASECSNFITQKELNVSSEGILLCQGTANATQNWETGWISAYTCDRGSDDILGMDETCLGWSGNIAMFGQLTFYMLAAYAVLFLLATWLENNGGYLYTDAFNMLGDRFSCCTKASRPDVRGGKLENVRGWCCRNTGERNITWITLVWSVVGSLYAILAAGHWMSMCDKLDTGLGRKMKIVDPETEIIVIENGHACATVGCEATFGSFFMWYSMTVVWMLLPQVFMYYFPLLRIGPVVATAVDTGVDSSSTAKKDVENNSGGSSNYSRHYTGQLKL